MANAQKRTVEKPITIGSCKAYLDEFDGTTIPSHTEICKAENQLAYSKGGATITYTKETYEAKDDFGLIRKTIITSDGASVKLGLLGWVGTTLAKLESTARVTEENGIRTTKIGGVGNDNGKRYVLCLHHEDKQDGDCWWTIVGKNTAGFELAYSADGETKVEPEFTAESMDDAGTLIIFEEEIVSAG